MIDVGRYLWPYHITQRWWCLSLLKLELCTDDGELVSSPLIGFFQLQQFCTFFVCIMMHMHSTSSAMWYLRNYSWLPVHTLRCHITMYIQYLVSVIYGWNVLHMCLGWKGILPKMQFEVREMAGIFHFISFSEAVAIAASTLTQQ